MQWLLILGIIFAGLPALGFMIAAAFMLYSTLREDDQGDKVILGVVVSIAIGFVFLSAYAGMKYLA